jgi:rod shape-determining protein MreB
LLIGETTAERIKKEIGAALPPKDDEGQKLRIKGRDLGCGIPKEIEVSERQISESLAEPLASIVESMKIALESTAPELSADIVDSGIMLTGGGALLKRMNILFKNVTGLPVSIAEDPLLCVAMGTGRALESIDVMKEVLLKAY